MEKDNVLIEIERKVDAKLRVQQLLAEKFVDQRVEKIMEEKYDLTPKMKKEDEFKLDCFLEDEMYNKGLEETKPRRLDISKPKGKFKDFMGKHAKIYWTIKIILIALALGGFIDVAVIGFLP